MIAGVLSPPPNKTNRTVRTNAAVATIAATPGQNHFGHGCSAAKSAGALESAAGRRSASGAVLTTI